jgi:hypothetical protein
MLAFKAFSRSDVRRVIRREQEETHDMTKAEIVAAVATATLCSDAGSGIS